MQAEYKPMGHQPGIEIERKFLVDPSMLPDGILNKGCFIKQWYLVFEPNLVRLRSSFIKDELSDWILTFKGKGLLSRAETEIQLLPEIANELIDMYPDAPFIQKTRYKIPISNGLVVELDHFFGTEELYSLWMAEIELPSETTEIEKPDWLGREVTFERGYTNMNLAQFGLPKTILGELI